LANIAKTSSNINDFVKKVAYSLTDTTSKLNKDDINYLTKWYNTNTNLSESKKKELDEKEVIDKWYLLGKKSFTPGKPPSTKQFQGKVNTPEFKSFMNGWIAAKNKHHGWSDKDEIAAKTFIAQQPLF
jgi:hypothetical protein